MERNFEALRQLRRVVEAAPDDLLHMRAIVELAKCGTARCALGWAIIDPWFQQNTAINELIPANFRGQAISDLPDHQGGHNTWKSLSGIFGIGLDNTDNLFAGDIFQDTNEHAVSKAEVLWNIDELLAERDALPYRAATWDNPPVYAGGIPNDNYEADPDEVVADEEES